MFYNGGQSIQMELKKIGICYTNHNKSKTRKMKNIDNVFKKQN